MNSFLIFFLLLAFQIGCSNSAPPCGDDRTKRSVIRVAERRAKEDAKLAYEIRGSRHLSDSQWEKTWEGIKPTLAFSLENITTKEFKKDIGTYVCAADISVTIKGEKNRHSITYSSELSAEDKNRFIIEVRGLGFLVTLF